MAWNHVDDTESVEKRLQVNHRVYDPNLGKYRIEHATSERTIALSTWRCSHCRALAVTKKGEKPQGKCGKCRS